MNKKKRCGLSAEQKALLWQRWKDGESRLCSEGVVARQRNLSAFLWARRLNSALSARLHKSLAEQDSKLVHR